MHRVAREHDAERRADQDRCKQVKENRVNIVSPTSYRYFASAALSAEIIASYFSPTASSLSLVMMFSPGASMWYSWMRVSTIASTGQASSQKPQ